MIHWRGPRGRQEGQALILIALMLMALTAAVGLAIDGGVGYSYNTQAERAAAAAALSGVVLMPDQFSPGQSVPPLQGNDATDRAIEEARYNGFDVNDTANDVNVVPAIVPNSANKLSVTVSRRVNTSFMQFFGVMSFYVSRTAIASYLPPLTIGQPGNHVGATVSTLGQTDFFFIRTQGYGANRGNGDAFTPQPCIDEGVNYSPTCSSDVHGISFANSPPTEPQDPRLPDKGGYNFRVYLPQGGIVWVYNAIFGPSFGTQDYCENAKAPSAFAGCNPNNAAGSPYYLHEDDSWVGNPSTTASYAAMRYSLYQVPNRFNRAEDSKMSELTVRPVDASNAWPTATPSYRDVNNGQIIAQQFDLGGNPTNMQAYHNWIDIANVSTAAAGDAGDPTLVQYVGGSCNSQPCGGPLTAGSYRLRVDTLEHDGGMTPPGQAVAHKAIAVRVTDALGNDCSTAVPACSIGAWNDLCIYTPMQAGTFAFPLVSIPADYASQPITMQFFDVGDSSGTVTLSILDPTTAPAYNVFTAETPKTVPIRRLGVDRSGNPPGVNQPVANYGTPATASYQPTVANTAYYDGDWVQMVLPLPDSYSPGANPWWQLQYTTTGGAFDTFTISVGFRGNPAHILQS